MTQRVRVMAVYPDETAQVLHIRQSACSGDCHQCAGCGAAQETMLLTVRNPIGANAGDLVEITSASGPVLAAAAVVYLLPLGLFFAGYLLGALLLGTGAIIGGIAFLAGVGIGIAYDRFVVKKKKTVYTITGFAGSNVSAAREKGDNYLD